MKDTYVATKNEGSGFLGKMYEKSGLKKSVVGLTTLAMLAGASLIYAPKVSAQETSTPAPIESIQKENSYDGLKHVQALNNAEYDNTIKTPVYGIPGDKTWDYKGKPGDWETKKINGKKWIPINNQTLSKDKYQEAQEKLDTLFEQGKLKNKYSIQEDSSPKIATSFTKKNGKPYFLWNITDSNEGLKQTSVRVISPNGKTLENYFSNDSYGQELINPNDLKEAGVYAIEVLAEDNAGHRASYGDLIEMFGGEIQQIQETPFSRTPNKIPNEKDLPPTTQKLEEQLTQQAYETPPVVNTTPSIPNNTESNENIISQKDKNTNKDLKKSKRWSPIIEISRTKGNVLAGKGFSLKTHIIQDGEEVGKLEYTLYKGGNGINSKKLFNGEDIINTNETSINDDYALTQGDYAFLAIYSADPDKDGELDVRATDMTFHVYPNPNANNPLQGDKEKEHKKSMPDLNNDVLDNIPSGQPTPKPDSLGITKKAGKIIATPFTYIFNESVKYKDAARDRFGSTDWHEDGSIEGSWKAIKGRGSNNGVSKLAEEIGSGRGIEFNPITNTINQSGEIWKNNTVNGLKDIFYFLGAKSDNIKELEKQGEVNYFVAVPTNLTRGAISLTLGNAVDIVDIPTLGAGDKICKVSDMLYKTGVESVVNDAPDLISLGINKTINKGSEKVRDSVGFLESKIPGLENAPVSNAVHKGVTWMSDTNHKIVGVGTDWLRNTLTAESINNANFTDGDKKLDKGVLTITEILAMYKKAKDAYDEHNKKDDPRPTPEEEVVQDDFTWERWDGPSAGLTETGGAAAN